MHNNYRRAGIISWWSISKFSQGNLTFLLTLCQQVLLFLDDEHKIRLVWLHLDFHNHNYLLLRQFDCNDVLYGWHFKSIFYTRLRLHESYNHNIEILIMRKKVPGYSGLSILLQIGIGVSLIGKLRSSLIYIFLVS